MRHVIAIVIVFCAAFSGLILGFIGVTAHVNGGFAAHFVNPIWSVFYGLGFEPALIWYRIHGPYRYGLFDLFGTLVWPIIASIVLYGIILRILSRWNETQRRVTLAAFAFSFFVIIPEMSLQPPTLIAFPLWQDCMIFSMPH